MKTIHELEGLEVWYYSDPFSGARLTSKVFHYDKESDHKIESWDDITHKIVVSSWDTSYHNGDYYRSRETLYLYEAAARLDTAMKNLAKARDNVITYETQVEHHTDALRKEIGLGGQLVLDFSNGS